MNKLKNKLIYLILSLFLFSSCESHFNRISIFLYSSKDTFINTLYDNLYKELSKNYEIKSYYAEESQTTQNLDVVNELETYNNKFLILNIVDRTSAKSIINKVKKYNIPLIFINREPLYEDIKDYENAFFIGSDPIKEGVLQGELIDSYFDGVNNFLTSFDKNNNGELDIVLIKGEQGHQDAENRSKYVVSTLTSLGYKVNILSTNFCNWKKDETYNYIESIYSEIKNDVDFFISNNDEMALGVISYLKEVYTLNNLEETIEKIDFFRVVGIDATSIAIEEINNDYMIGTIKNDEKEQVNAILELINYKENDLDLDLFPYTFINERYIRIEGYIVKKTLS